MGAYSRKFDEILKFLLGYFLNNFIIFHKIGICNIPNHIFFVKYTLLQHTNEILTVSKICYAKYHRPYSDKGKYQKCQKLVEIVDFSKSSYFNDITPNECY